MNSLVQQRVNTLNTKKAYDETFLLVPHPSLNNTKDYIRIHKTATSKPVVYWHSNQTGALDGTPVSFSVFSSPTVHDYLVRSFKEQNVNHTIPLHEEHTQYCEEIFRERVICYSALLSAMTRQGFSSHALTDALQGGVIRSAKPSSLCSLLTEGLLLSQTSFLKIR